MDASRETWEALSLTLRSITQAASYEGMGEQDLRTYRILAKDAGRTVDLLDADLRAQPDPPEAAAAPAKEKEVGEPFVDQCPACGHRGLAGSQQLGPFCPACKEYWHHLGNRPVKPAPKPAPPAPEAEECPHYPPGGVGTSKKEGGKLA